MSKKYFLILYFVLLTNFYSYTYSQDVGSQLWYSGFNSGLAGQGFGGVASKNSGFYSFINPATIATTEDIRFFSSGNIINTEWGGSFGISAPIEPGGMLYAGSQHLSLDGTTLAQIGYGKKVRSDIALGMEGILTVHHNAKRNHIGGGFNLGILWLPKDFIPINNGWGFVDFSLGGTFKTVFFPTGGICYNYTPEILFQIGIEATFMKYQYAQWKFIIDYSIGFVPLSYPDTIHLQTWTSLGTTWTFWNIWDISVGTILGNHGLGFGSNKVLPFTLGTALGYNWSKASFKLSYAFGGSQFFNKTEYLHTIGLEVGMGTKKSTNMYAVINNVNSKEITNYFSPNNDLIKDTVTLLPKVIGMIPITEWRISIKNQQGITVRTFEPAKKKSDQLNKVSKVFYNYFMPTKSNDIPNKIIWDGTDNNHRMVSDGIYYASLYIRFNETEHAVSKSNIIVVDTIPPNAQLNISDKNRFIYLGDNTSTPLNIEQILSPNDPWFAQLIDNENKTVIDEWIWKQGYTPITNTWRLHNPKRINVATGSFSYIVNSYDKAGNFTETKLTNIIIETASRKSKITSKQLAFSPNNDDILDITTIDIENKALSGIKNSSIVVYNYKGEKCYIKQLDISNYPTQMTWDGYNTKKQLADDGKYILVLENHYADGNQISSPPLLIDLDTTPPNFKVEFSPKIFSPHSKNTNDTLKIDFSAEDIHNISNWTIIIKKSNDILHSFSGNNEFTNLSWFPTKDSPILSSEELIFEIAIQDTLGNTRKTPFHSLRTDILTDNIDKNLIVSTNIAYFKTSIGVIADDLFPYLDEIWNYYQYYPNYHLTILAQASYAEANNSKTEAYKLGILRGDAIKAYLINKGVHPNRIDIKVEIYDEKNKNKQKLLRQAKVYIKKYDN